MQAETAPDILSTAFQPSDSAAPEIVRSILENFFINLDITFQKL